MADSPSRAVAPPLRGPAHCHRGTGWARILTDDGRLPDHHRRDGPRTCPTPSSGAPRNSSSTAPRRHTAAMRIAPGPRLQLLDGQNSNNGVPSDGVLATGTLTLTGNA